MRFTVHDVGHGFCAHLEHDNGNVMLWDCGHKADPEHRPSRFLPESGIRNIHRMFVTNYDEDHISDLPNLRHAVRIEIFHRNRSITPVQLRRLKEESRPISTAMESLLSMHESYTGNVIDPPHFPSIDFTNFQCTYLSDFQDTNNLSHVTFLETPMSNFVIPGDVEKPAWEKLLQNSNFQARLKKVNVFIASHHGRASGYCRRVFDYCSPAVIIFSDGPKKYATQEEANTYASHATGVNFNGRTRRVLTTRSDGTIVWNF